MRAACAITECLNESFARGWCQKHYLRWKKYDDPLGRSSRAFGSWVIGNFKDDPKLFWARVDKNGPIPTHAPHLGPCWCWTAAQKEKLIQTYGSVTWKGKKGRLAHRVAWELTVGPVPVGMELDHLCMNRSCVRPSHLEPVTHAENMRRARAALPPKTHCRNGHPAGPGKCKECRRLWLEKAAAK